MDELPPCLIHEAVKIKVRYEKPMKSGRNKNRVDDALIVEMRAFASQGHSVPEVAAEFGLAPSTIRRHVFDVARKDPRNVGISEEKIRLIREYRALGATIKDITRALGCSTQTVRKYELD